MTRFIKKNKSEDFISFGNYIYKWCLKYFREFRASKYLKTPILSLKIELKNQMNSLFHYKYTKRCFIIPRFYKIGNKLKMTTVKTF